MKNIAKILGVFTVFFSFVANTVYSNYQIPDNNIPVSTDKPEIIKESPFSYYLHIEKTESSISLSNNQVPSPQRYPYNHFSVVILDSEYQEVNPFIHNFYFEEGIELSLCSPDIIFPFHYFFDLF